MSVSDVRRDLPALVRAQERTKAEPIEITRRGRRKAVLLSARRYDEMVHRSGRSRRRTFSGLAGTVRILGDLEDGSRNLWRDYFRALHRAPTRR